MIGSIRKERQSDKPATVLLDLLSKQSVEPVVLDLRELNLPVFDDGIDHEGRSKLLEAYEKMDGLILVSPEYNNSIPSSVKNAIDFARSRELSGKPLAICTTSDGNWGGVRATQGIRDAWFGDGGIVVPPSLPTPHVDEFDASAPPEQWLERANGFIERSLQWFRIIKSGKQQEV